MSSRPWFLIPDTSTAVAAVRSVLTYVLVSLYVLTFGTDRRR